MLTFTDHTDADHSERLGFAGRSLDPKAEKRDEHSLSLAFAKPHARFLLISRNKLITRTSEAGDVQALFSHAELAELLPEQNLARNDSLILLGETEDTPYLALDLDIDPEQLPAPFGATEYRALYTHNLISPEEAGMVAQAAALLSWHRSHRFCGRCGHPSQMRIGGYKRVCSQCQAEHFPRTDPVVIMLTIHRSATGERCLLARSPHFAPLTYSCLAGFVEPAETIENAVRRELREESGLAIGRVTYHASQPWPFPYSLMIGCFAQARSDEITLDQDELEDGGWFSREEARAMLNDQHAQGLRTPPSGTIANALIRHWVENP